MLMKEYQVEQLETDGGDQETKQIPRCLGNDLDFGTFRILRGCRAAAPPLQEGLAFHDDDVGEHAERDTRNDCGHDENDGHQR